MLVSLLFSCSKSQSETPSAKYECESRCTGIQIRSRGLHLPNLREVNKTGQVRNIKIYWSTNLWWLATEHLERSIEQIMNLGISSSSLEHNITSCDVINSTSIKSSDRRITLEPQRTCASWLKMYSCTVQTHLNQLRSIRDDSNDLEPSSYILRSSSVIQSALSDITSKYYQPFSFSTADRLLPWESDFSALVMARWCSLRKSIIVRLPCTLPQPYPGLFRFQIYMTHQDDLMPWLL